MTIKAPSVQTRAHQLCRIVYGGIGAEFGHRYFVSSSRANIRADEPVYSGRRISAGIS